MLGSELLVCRFGYFLSSFLSLYYPLSIHTGETGGDIFVSLATVLSFQASLALACPNFFMRSCIFACKNATHWNFKVSYTDVSNILGELNYLSCLNLFIFFFAPLSVVRATADNGHHTNCPSLLARQDPGL